LSFLTKKLLNLTTKLKTMKKVILLLVTVLAFNVSNAQEKTTLNLSAYHNMSVDDFSVLVEADIVTPKKVNLSLNTSFTKGTNIKTFNVGLGRKFTSEAATLTPSLILGTNTLKGNNFFYGGDLDFDARIYNFFSLSAKYQITHKAKEKLNSNGFTSAYFVGFKIHF